MTVFIGPKGPVPCLGAICPPCSCRCLDHNAARPANDGVCSCSESSTLRASIDGPARFHREAELSGSLWCLFGSVYPTPVELMLSVPPASELSILERLNILDIRCLLKGCSIELRAKLNVESGDSDEDRGSLWMEAAFRVELGQSGRACQYCCASVLVSVLMGLFLIKECRVQ